MNEEILEGNKLIAEFMGEEVLQINKGDLYPVIKGEFGLKQTRYHASWDWLMPVVEKVSKIKCIWHDPEPSISDTYYPRTFGMLNAETGNPMVRLNSTQIFDAKTLIEATWLSIVDFIKWYNDQDISVSPPKVDSEGGEKIA